MEYQCLKKQRVEDEASYALVPVRLTDIESIRLMRNAQIDFLRQQKSISQREQEEYYQKVIFPDCSKEKPAQILFSLLYQDQWIGYGGLVHIDWAQNSAEVSFLVENSRLEHYSSDFTHFLKLIRQVAFDQLSLHRLTAETYSMRRNVRDLLEDNGFSLQKTLRDHVYKQGKWQDAWLLASMQHKIHPQSAVLITSLSKKIPLAEAVKKAAREIYGNISIHGSDINSSCMGRYFVDDFWCCPPLSALKFETILNYCKRYHIEAIIPTRDDDLLFYSRIKDKLLKEGIHVLVSSEKTILTCLNKLHFAQFLMQHNFPAIPSFLSPKEIAANRLVVKGIQGAGSIEIALDVDHEAASHHAHKLSNPIFQPFIEGKEWSIDLYRTLKGEVKGVIARYRNVTVSGESQVTTTHSNPSLEKLCSDIAHALDLYGPAVFQVIEDHQGTFHVIECNPRFGGASTVSIAAGLDTFTWFFAECEGKELNGYPFKRSSEIRQIRFPHDRIVPCPSSFSI